MTKTPALANATLIICSECGEGNFHRDEHTHSVTCTDVECQRNIIVSLDVERYLEPSESLVWTPENLLAVVTD